MTKHRKYIFVQGSVVLLVMASFRFIADKRMASVLATSCFLLGSAVVIFSEGVAGWRAKSLSLISTIVFALGFIAPVIALRILSWEGSFEEQTIFGLTGAQFHRASNYAFLIMLVCYFIESFRGDGRGLNEKTQSK